MKFVSRVITMLLLLSFANAEEKYFVPNELPECRYKMDIRIDVPEEQVRGRHRLYVMLPEVRGC